MVDDKRHAVSEELPSDAERTVLPLIEETLTVTKREVVTGRVRVRTVTEAVEEQVRQELSGERIEVEHVPIDQLVELGAAPPQPRTEGDVTIVPVLEEILVIEKRLLIKEELRITRHRTSEMTDVSVALRKQRAVVERFTGADATPSTEIQE